MRDSQTFQQDVSNSKHDQSTWQDTVSHKRRINKIFQNSHNFEGAKRKERLLGLASLDKAVEYINQSYNDINQNSVLSDMEEDAPINISQIQGELGDLGHDKIEA